MKLKGSNKQFRYSLVMVGILSSLFTFKTQAGAMGPVTVDQGKAYVGVFGGGGASNTLDITQYGTAFVLESGGGPLAVDAFGRSNSPSVGLVGGQVGYQWSPILLSGFNSSGSISPAVELEGFYLGKGHFASPDLVNTSIRLTEHDFNVSYPMNTGVFVASSVLNFNPSQSKWHPFVALGIGGAVVSISNATSIQVQPAESVNHYNRNPNDTISAFAGQAKAGIKYELSEHLNLFAEYRGVYITDTTFVFGSTVYPDHAATSPWLVKLGSQYYNTGTVGIQFSI